MILRRAAMSAAGVLLALMAAAPLPLDAQLGLPPSLRDQPDAENPQHFEFRAPPTPDDPNTAAVMRDLAERLLPVYSNPDPEQYLANLATLQMVAGDYETAFETRQSLEDRRKQAGPAGGAARTVVYDLYSRARALEVTGNIPFDQAYTQAFREVVPKLSDQDGYAVTGWLDAPVPPFRDAVQAVFDRLRPGTYISQAEALDVIRTYLAFDAHRSFAPLIDALASDETGRRYAAEEDVLVARARGNEIYARILRPRSGMKPLPALLEVTTDPSRNEAKSSAAHGYVGVVAYVRRTSRRKDALTLVPFEHDGEYVRTVIGWIAKQPWSDGRVGMVGIGYGGFAAWAAAKHPPAALKAIATQDALAPGIDFPSEGRVFRNDAYRWALVNTQGVVDTGDDDAQWDALDRKWYASGRRYRDYDRLAKKPSRMFRRWLNHPSYDAYWQKMIPQGKEFGKIDIPVFASTGYYSGGAVGTLYYFAQATQYKPDADHTLLVGPWDERGMEDRPSAELGGYTLDSAALVDVRELRFQWFDHIFKGAAKPELLADRVNWQVMGANQWRHAPTLAAMGAGSQRFYLEGPGPEAGASPRLSPDAPSTPGFVPQVVRLMDRADVDLPPSGIIQSKSLDVRNAVLFVSEPLKQPVEFGGLLSGQLDFVVNKMDMDLHVTVYEQLAGGEYLQLADPYEFRASYVRDRVHRHLLQAGVRQQLAFRSEQFAGRKLQAGSRVVLVLGIVKRPDREINYGAGNDVSEESKADARVPMKIRWYGSSYIELPVR